jgi:hypothetical protein
MATNSATALAVKIVGCGRGWVDRSVLLMGM